MLEKLYTNWDISSKPADEQKPPLQNNRRIWRQYNGLMSNICLYYMWDAAGIINLVQGTATSTHINQTKMGGSMKRKKRPILYIHDIYNPRQKYKCNNFSASIFTVFKTQWENVFLLNCVCFADWLFVSTCRSAKWSETNQKQFARQFLFEGKGMIVFITIKYKYALIYSFCPFNRNYFHFNLTLSPSLLSHVAPASPAAGL